MTASDSSNDLLLERLAEEFVERHRRGERPALTEYANLHPDLAAEIRDLFPTLVRIEHLKPAAGDLTGGFVPEPTPADGQAPERLGEYRILREVGHGGMGVVYEAEQESLGRHVALKVLPRQALLKATYLERFRQEAKAAAKLHHTNIVPVFGVGECDGTHYYAMQFIRGESLDKVLSDLARLRAAPGEVTGAASAAHSLLTGRFAAPLVVPPAPRTPSAPTEVNGAPGSSTLSAGGSEAQYFRGIARVGVQVADALAYAHRQAILHRDIKPSNVLLDQQGTAWVTDFGLAKAEGADDLTQAGDIVGTIRFMAPERFDGRSLPQSDVYSLGVTLYEMLALRPAFDDTNKARLVEKVLHEPPVALRKIDGHVPRDLETIVFKCLAKDPAERYATADLLAEDLRRFLADRPIQARRAGRAERLWRWCRRNPAVASLLSAVALLLLAVAGVSTFMAARLNSALGKTQAAEREARLREAEALVGQAHGIRYSRRIGQRFEALTALGKAGSIGRELGQPPEWFDRLRNEAAGALALPDVEFLRQWQGPHPDAGGVAFDGDLRLYALPDLQGNVSVRRVADDGELVQLPGSGSVVDPYLSPDGQLLAVRDHATKRLKVWRLADPAPELIHQADDVAQGVDFSPDNKHLLYIHLDSRVSIVSLEDGEVKSWPIRGAAAALPCYSPDGSRVMFSTKIRGQETLMVCEVLTGAEVVALPLPARITQYDWHPSGRMVAACCVDGRIRLWDTNTWRQAAAPDTDPSRGGVTFRFAPDGEHLIVNDWSSLLRVCELRTGRQVFATPMSYPMYRMHPDGRLPVSERDQVKLIRVATGREFRTLARRAAAGRGGYVGPSPARAVALDPEGRLLAAITAERSCALVDSATGEELAVIPFQKVQSVTFDTSGALLIHGAMGLQRWPAQVDPATGSCRVGPPETLFGPPCDGQHDSSPDGRVLALPRFKEGALLLRRDRPGAALVLGPQNDVRLCAVSPDGRWVATSSHSDRLEVGVKVWDAVTGRLVKNLPIRSGFSTGFSPDGKWLVTTYGGCRLWAVDTWEAGPVIGKEDAFAFSPDGRILAVGGEAGVIRLVEPGTGREYVRLDAPEQTRLYPCCFTPDGARLIALGAESHALHVWDLRLVRRQLAEMGLDWDAPPYPEAAAAPAGLTEVRVIGAKK